VVDLNDALLELEHRAAVVESFVDFMGKLAPSAFRALQKALAAWALDVSILAPDRAPNKPKWVLLGASGPLCLDAPKH
jgi:hypothetical protein